VDTDIIIPQTNNKKISESTKNNKIISESTNKQQDNISIHKQTTRSYQYPQTNNKIISVSTNKQQDNISIHKQTTSLFVDTDMILLFVCGY
jgi:hypothetical protein